MVSECLDEVGTFKQQTVAAIQSIEQGIEQNAAGQQERLTEELNAVNEATEVQLADVVRRVGGQELRVSGLFNDIVDAKKNLTEKAAALDKSIENLKTQDLPQLVQQVQSELERKQGHASA
ncbi:unnamed protein product, partial [Amoebophrya sp. A120]|eukprot:GSA120T00020186001.1